MIQSEPTREHNNHRLEVLVLVEGIDPYTSCEWRRPPPARPPPARRDLAPFNWWFSDEGDACALITSKCVCTLGAGEARVLVEGYVLL